jgi:UDP-N-acetylmuramoyl-tripeptide--D-alanyl-D-alanine ligase
MRELGEQSAVAHMRVGRTAARLGVGRLIVAGEAARPISAGAATYGMAAEDIEFWPDTQGLADHLRSITGQDLVLIKGSHGTELWKVADSLIGKDA